MSIDLSKYLCSNLLWKGITNYVMDHRDFYDISNNDEKGVRNLLVQTSKQIMEDSDSKSFVKFIDRTRNYRNNPIRETYYKLIFSLKLNELPNKKGETEANSLLQKYLQQNELSPKSVNEFILINCLRLNLTWKDFVELCEEFKEKADSIRPASLKLEMGQTKDLYQRMIKANISSKDELEGLLQKEDFWPYFAKTRNTQYLALFDNANWSVFRDMRGENEIDDAENVLNIISQKVNDEIMGNKIIKEYYLDLFSFDTGEGFGFLKLDEIEMLADRNLFSNTFYTLKTFEEIAKRERSFDIEAGTYLIRLISELGPDDLRDELGEYIECIDFANYDETITTINNYLINAGYGEVSKADPFGCLFLDTYKEVLDINKDLIEKTNSPIAENTDDYHEIYSSDIKKQLISNLRGYLREIILIA